MSRLLNNSEQIRNQIEARNLYTPEDPYNLDQGIVVKTINNLASIISPFDSVDISNTVLGRLAGIQTPITQIGLAMLGKQFAATVRSLASAEFLPTINIGGIFRGEDILLEKKDYRITPRENRFSVGSIIEEVTGVYRPINPFKGGATSITYFKQSGKGQQSFHIESLNKWSYYKRSDSTWIDAVNGTGLQFKQERRWYDRETNNYTQRIWIVGKGSPLYPFDTYKLDDVNASNSTLNRELNRLNAFLGENAFEYGSTQRYLEALGRTRTVRKAVNDSKERLTYGFEPNEYGLNDDPNGKLIWGRDGTSFQYDATRNGVDPNPYEFPSSKIEGFGDSTKDKNFDRLNDRFNAFGSRTGLLNYTKELLNSKGEFGYFDMTKKKFIDREGRIMSKGSPITKELDGSINRSRQHTVGDPYNRFVKAIRYKGNEIYGGNENSVVNKAVIPKIHPTAENETINVKNLMFSLENLAARVYKDDDNKVAYLDDEFGTQLPYSEAGENGGRLMWFAPYDIKFNEQAIAKHETTMFLGRSEPIYTYSNSERVGTLSFKLLIDYPPQVKGLNQTDGSSFFAFGGNGENDVTQVNINKGEEELNDTIEERDKIKPTTDEIVPDDLSFPPSLKLYFPNDVPDETQIDDVINTFIKSKNVGGKGYEDGLPTLVEEGISLDELDGRDYGLNQDFITKFRDAVEDALSEDKRRFVKIEILGGSTQLFNTGGDENTEEARRAREEYNLALGQRRAETLKSYLNEIYLEVYGRTLEQDNINVTTKSLGLSRAPDSTRPSDSIPDLTAKSNRFAIISFSQDTTVTTSRERELTSKEIAEKKILDEKVQALKTKINRAKQQLSRGFENTFNQYTIEDGILKGFSSTEVNKFQPVFHSQTPEDLHRRLTFLHQCTRQGNAVRKLQNPNNGTTNFSAKNAVFGRQPIQVLRLGDLIHTKIVMDNISFEYGDAPWDLNPEGMGAQFMYVDVTMQFKIIGGQSLKTPIDALQNAVSFNYYANSTFYNKGVYQTPTRAEVAQVSVNEGIATENAKENEDKLKKIKDLNSAGQS